MCAQCIKFSRESVNRFARWPAPAESIPSLAVTAPRLLNCRRIFCCAFLALGLFACAEAPQPVPPSGPPAAEAPGRPAAAPATATDGYTEPLPPLPKSGYFLQKIADGVYFFSTGYYNTLFVVADGGVILADPIRGAGALIKKAMAKVTPLPVKFLIYTHAHLDHIGDAHLFAAGAQIVAHEQARVLLSRYQDAARPPPQIAFRRNYTLEYGGRRVELIYPGEGHGAGNAMIFLPREKVLMFTGVGAPRALPGRGFESVDLYGQVLGLQRAVKLDFKTWVPGHGHRPGTREEMQQLLQYYYDSRQADEDALRRVSFEEAVNQSESRDPLTRLESYHRAVAEACYRALKPRYKPRMMGFEAYALSHCTAWTEFHLTHKAPAAGG